MNFDTNKCLKLLKERKSLEKEGKLFHDYDEAKNNELINYLTLIEDEIFWESRKEYIQILDLFVSKKISLDQFFEQFSSLRGLNLRSARLWKKKLEEEALVVFPKSNEINIQVNPKSCGFTEIISYLDSLVDICDPDVTLEMNVEQPELLFYGISEEYLRLLIQENIFPKLEKYCDLNESSFRPQVDLDQRIRRSYLICIISSLGLLISLITNYL